MNQSYLAVPLLAEFQKLLYGDGPTVITIQQPKEHVYINLVRVFHAVWQQPVELQPTNRLQRLSELRDLHSCFKLLFRKFCIAEIVV